MTELSTLLESQVSVITIMSAEYLDTILNSSSIISTSDLALETNREGREVFDVVVLILIQL